MLQTAIPRFYWATREPVSKRSTFQLQYDFFVRLPDAIAKYEHDVRRYKWESYRQEAKTSLATVKRELNDVQVEIVSRINKMQMWQLQKAINFCNKRQLRPLPYLEEV